jgi:hypothetical protein
MSDDKDMIRRGDVLAALKTAYLEGFNRSGEGYNAEFPFDGDGAESNPFWSVGRDVQVSAILAALPAVTPHPPEGGGDD